MENVSPHPLGLVVVSGPATGRRIVLDRPVLLGRDPRSRIPFSDERMSRHHALIDIVDDRPVLRDLGSKNGTFVNGREIEGDHALQLDDRVRVGKTLLAVVQLDGTDSDVEERENDSLETYAEGVASDGSDTFSESIKINRIVLRRATELAARVAGLIRNRHPVASIVSAVRKDFRADSAGIFLIEPLFEPVFIEGELVLSRHEIEELSELRQPALGRSLLASALHPDESQSEPVPSTLLAFPIWCRDAVGGAMLLKRHHTRPFGPEALEMAEALSECLRVVPMQRVLNIDQADPGADNLGIVGSSEAMNGVRELIRSYAKTDGTVLICGESGTGKELCARAIARLSPRRFAAYVEVNCACMMPELIEAELFGHERGAFTGAESQKAGKLEIADGGTLFLDEIGELPIDLQAKLLRVLEGQAFYRLGGTELIKADVRFICATNRKLDQMVKDGTFREDLYHRINVLSIDVPPLRSHVEDIPSLVTHLLAEIQDDLSDPVQFTVTPRAYRRLLSHKWPGNVRELRNVLQRIVLLANGSTIDERMIPPEIGKDNDSTTASLPRLQMLTEMLEREEISRTLTECNGQKSLAARLLGISRPTLDKKIKTYGLGTLAAPGNRNA